MVGAALMKLKSSPVKVPTIITFLYNVLQVMLCSYMCFDALAIAWRNNYKVRGKRGACEAGRTTRVFPGEWVRVPIEDGAAEQKTSCCKAPALEGITVSPIRFCPVDHYW